MGATISKNDTKLNNSITNEAYSTCAGDYGSKNGQTASNETNMTGVKHVPPSWCKDICSKHPVTGVEQCGSNFEINQAAKVDADCVIKQMQDNLATAVSTLSAKAKGELSFMKTNSENISDITNDIKNAVKASCENQTNSNKINWTDMTLGSCNVYAIQNLNSKKKCEIDNTQKAVTQLTTTTSADSESKIGIGGSFVIFIIVFGIVLIVGFVLYIKAGLIKSIVAPQNKKE
jgi:hypothetical protein